MKPRFKEREYLEDLINSGMKNFKFSNLRLKSNDKNQNTKGIPSIFTYHPLLKSLSAITDKNLSNLYMKKVFTSLPMVLFRSACKLNSG